MREARKDTAADRFKDRDMEHTFNGGIHPYDGKDLSKDKKIIEYSTKGEAVYPLSQHIGAPAKPVVKKGDAVLAGQLIAEAGGFVSAPVYSAVSGTVKAIEKRRVPTGDMVESVVIDNDGEFTPAVSGAEDESRKPDKDAVPEGTVIIERIKAAGIVGMGGAGFPTHVKLSPKEPDKIEYIIANCAECEPYLTSDYRMMLEHPDELVGGLKLVLSLFKNARGIIAIEDNKPDCIELLKKVCRDEPGIEVMSLATKYPQGSERQLIYAVTGRAIHSKMLPADAGCIVDNCDTLIAIYDAVINEKPLTHRIVTVTGDGIENPCNFRVPIGTPMYELIEAAGGLKEGVEKVVCGGPMMGFALFDLNVPVTKTSSALLCIRSDEVSKCKPSPCINCGQCVEACPSRIIPARLAAFADHGDEEAFEAYHGMECMECGCCSYVCPAKRQLTQSIKSMRKALLAKKRK